MRASRLATSALAGQYGFARLELSDAGPPEFDVDLAERLRVHFIQPPPRLRKDYWTHHSEDLVSAYGGEIGCSVCALTSDEHWRHAGFPDLETRCLERNYSRRRRGTAQAKVTAVLCSCFGVTVSSRSCHREG